MTNNNAKTHWLQNPNKNYLGHWDLPNGEDVILTIDTAKWDTVRNPIIDITEAKRVITFKETYAWVKPFICNQINAQAICKVTGKSYMEDASGKPIRLYVGKTKVKGEEVSCLRIRMEKSESLRKPQFINAEEIKNLQERIIAAELDEANICAAYEIKSLKEFPKARLSAIITNLKSRIATDENN